MKEFIVCLVLWSVSSAYSVAINGRIIGGQITDISKLPWQVSLQFDGSHVCGGTIIARNWIVTAAHCTLFDDQTKYSIRAGSNNKRSGGQSIKVKRVITHENFSLRNGDNDIALLELASGITFNQNSMSIQLASVDGVDGTHCKVSGWGETEHMVDDDLFRSGDVFLVNRDICKQTHSQSTITESMICAGVQQGGVDACFGDSGGPLVCNHALMGVVSWSDGCGLPETPGVYARISTLRSWIRTHSGV